MIIDPKNVPGDTKTYYPAPFQYLVAGRIKQALGKAVGMKTLGVTLITLPSGGCSTLRHWHLQQDEFVYIIEGEVTLIDTAGEHLLKPGMRAGFPAGQEDGHELINKSNSNAVLLQINHKTPNQEIYYPDDDIFFKEVSDGWIVTHKDGTLWES
ncbi:MAG: hypothetical protein RLZZ339_916 [Cyanobacteriota bacterium]|jgi:uncharacterized cupin superfamily protein